MRPLHLVFFSSVLLLMLATDALPAETIHPALRAHMETLEGHELISVKIRLSEQFDGHGFMKRNSGLDRQDRRARLMEAGAAFASERQEAIVQRLRAAEAAGAAQEIRTLWIVNMVTATIRNDWIDRIASLKGIEEIGWVRELPVEMLHDAKPGLAAPSRSVAWGVEKIKAPEVWDLGYRGQGVVLCNIDSGTDYTHPDLADHIWQNPGEIAGNLIDDDDNGYVDDIMGWDFYSDDANPMDSYGHGTRAAGIAVGDGTGGTQTGVAPEAELMVCRVHYETDHLAAQQYALENGAHVITSSYSYKWNHYPRPDYHAFRQASVMLLAAGIIHHNSSSNDGNTIGAPWNVSTPANCPPPWLHPEQALKGQVAGTLAIGGTLSDDTIYDKSPLGPSTWEDIRHYDPVYPYIQNSDYWDYPYSTDPMGLIKVDLCAPTGGVPTTEAGGGYYPAFSGTSAATPHCGGAACLLLSANPDLTPEKICQALKMNTVDLGAPGLDTQFGAGRLDVYEAAINVLTTLEAENRYPPIGSLVTLHMGGPANAFYLLCFSLHLGKVEVPAYQFEIDLFPPYEFFQSTHLDENGENSFSFTIPYNPLYIGLEGHFQTWTDDRAGDTGLILISLHETLTIQ